jgi:hypothetical protein
METADHARKKRPILLMIAVWDVPGGWGVLACLIALSLFFE